MHRENLTLVDHPLVVDSLAHLRDRHTDLKKFRYHSDQLCRFLFAEAMRGLSCRFETIATPLEEATVQKLADEVVIVPVLRAGLAMLPAALSVLPKAKVGFAGLVRDEATAVASEYYWKLPPITHDTVVLVPDPMLATGGSIEHVLSKIAKHHPKEMRVVCVVAAPEGVERIHAAYPHVRIIAAALDRGLDERKYILPGLGDYGDRYFGT
ncbi:MAG TPA: uracil phosphoribosyltransferase [bacterium]|nr:uracil phosphoribosyltransferase [bacterium]